MLHKAVILADMEMNILETLAQIPVTDAVNLTKCQVRWRLVEVRISIKLHCYVGCPRSVVCSYRSVRYFCHHKE